MHAYLFCHREERGDVASSFPQQRSLPNEIAALRSQ